MVCKKRTALPRARLYVWLALATALGCSGSDPATSDEETVVPSLRTLSATLRCSDGPAGTYTSASPLALGVDFGQSAFPSAQLRGIRVIRADVSLLTDPATLADLACLRRIEGNVDVARGSTDANAAWQAQGLEGLREVTGSLSVGNLSGALTGANGLSGLSKVGGYFSLYAPEARNLDGLDSLKTVGADFGLTVGPPFQSLRALRSLESVTGELRIDCSGGGCASIVDLRGIEGLRSLGGLSLSYLTALTKLRGLPQVRRFTRGLTLSGLDGLRSLEGLDSVTTIDGDVRIQGAALLANVNALASLRNVGGNLEISSAPLLVNLDALARLKSVRALSLQDLSALRALPRFMELSALEGLALGSLPALPSLRGLERIRSVSGYLWVIAGDGTTLEGLDGLVSAGDVQINGNAITTLRPLRNLSSAKSLAIGRTQLTSLRGLERLTALADLTLQDNPQLASLEGVTSLAQLNGMIMLGDNVRLASLSGLSNLRQVGSLVFWNLPLLANFTGLARLQTITQGVELRDLPALASFVGLESLASVNGPLQLQALTGLTSLTGLSGLNHVAGVLTLRELPSLTSLSGANALASTEGLVIYDNPLLASLAGLSALRSVGGGRLVISWNPRLPGCEAAALASRLGSQCGCPAGTSSTCVTSPSQCMVGRPCLLCTSPLYCKCEGSCMCTGNDNAPVCAPPG